MYLDPPYVKEKHNSFTNYTADGFSLEKHYILFTKIKELQIKNILFLVHNSKIGFVMDFFKGFLIFESVFVHFNRLDIN